MKSLFICFSLILTIGLWHFPAHAQSAMSEDDISEAFAKQKSRGLVLVPTGQQPEVSADTSQKDSTKVDYVALPQDEQVNVSIHFDLDSAALREDQKPALAALCNVLKKSPDVVLRIIGHTDITGTVQYNERLSVLRAEEVKRYLAANCGVPEGQMQAVGVGARYLLDEKDPRGEVNRRVEFQAQS